MEKHYTVTLTETYEHLTVNELNEQLNSLHDDYCYDWEIKKDYDRDYDGYEEFNGHYNLMIKCSISKFGETTVDDLQEFTKECYKILRDDSE